MPTPIVQEALLQARADAVDAVVSFGGGSCADLGKAVCFFTEQESGIPSTAWVDRPALPHVSIPTTYSGAELTPFFGMTDPATHAKSGGGGPTCAPVAAVYDPELTLSTPVRVSAETGHERAGPLRRGAVVAEPHARGRGASPSPGPGGSPPRCRSSSTIPDDVTVRAAMFEGAVLGGRCLQNASMGVHHGLAQLIGGRTGIPHGLANAVLLAHSIRFNADAVPDAVRRLGEAIGAPDDPAGAVAALVERLGLPSRLGDCGVTLEDVDAVAQQAPTNRNVSLNPRPVSVEDAKGILLAAY